MSTETSSLAAEPDALLAARLIERLADRGGDTIVVARSENRAARLRQAVATLAPGLEASLLPAWDCLPYDRVMPALQIMGARMEALHRAAARDRGKLLLIGSVDAVTQRLPPPGAWREIALRVGEAIDPGALERPLAALGYAIEDRVDEPGEAAIHGSVIDVFPPASAVPYRINHSEGAIADMRPFDPATQRSGEEEVASLVLGPASEALLDETAPPDDRPEHGMEQLLPSLYPALTTIFDAMPGAEIVLDPETEALVSQREADIRDAFRAMVALSPAEGAASGSPWVLYLDHPAWREALSDRAVVRLVESDDVPAGALPRFAGPAEFVRFVRERAGAGGRIGLAGPERHRRVLLRALAVPDAPVVPGWLPLLAAEAGTIARLDGTLEAGFQTENAAVIAPVDVLGARARPRQAGATAVFETAMTPGDAVIHLDHGLGVLRGIETVATGDLATDCLQLEYAGGTGLLVPADEIDRVWRYGADPDGVALDRLNGEAWPKRRAEIERDIGETAQRLVALARAREAASAPRMRPERAPYARLVARFPFTPTSDQEDAIASVEADLGSGRPMERLVCGDVGFGKTEVAIRAAGMAALSGWQVAIVAPTTVLARQHIQTFGRRFAGLGVRVAGLSRLTSPSEAREVRAGLADGSIGIVIGTQALASKTVRFKKLGLLIVDEEQRFGVRQKNALRKFGTGVHTLTLTATPIPRTLQTALAGLQELSVLATAPARRQPIRCVRARLDTALVAQALRRERRRGGQSFVVCPRVEDLAPMRARLREAVPELRLVEAHGGMKADALDEAMLRFAAGRGDVLLATNIIEAGLDLPRANTMLIWHPDRFGLAQLHQLRGRVGRGRARGAVYLLTEPDANLTAAAEKRLEALESFDRLGSGFAISARDLDLRGAGDLLGEDQAGHVKLLGLDLYRDMLARAMRTARGEEEIEDWSPRITLDITAYLPSDYIADGTLRVELHDRLGRALRLGESTALDEIRDELEDRFGALPAPVENLVSIAFMRMRCRKLGIATLDAGPSGVAITLRPGRRAKPPSRLERKGERLVFHKASADDASRLATVHALLDMFEDAMAPTHRRGRETKLHERQCV